MQKGKHVELMLNRRVKMVKAKTNSDYDETEVDISLSHRLNAVKPSKTLSICHHATALLQADFDSPDVKRGRVDRDGKTQREMEWSQSKYCSSSACSLFPRR